MRQRNRYSRTISCQVGVGWIVYSERSDDSVRLISPSGTVRMIAAVPGCRYGDFWLDLGRKRVLAVREDHRNRPPADPEHAIVALSLDPADYTNPPRV
jgi:hypothetical protein